MYYYICTKCGALYTYHNRWYDGIEAEFIKAITPNQGCYYNHQHYCYMGTLIFVPEHEVPIVKLLYTNEKPK